VPEKTGEQGSPDIDRRQRRLKTWPELACLYLRGK
jgi:hypothetical protein